MDHIEQLKKIRAEAIARMRNSPDFKMAGKLGQLIVELGETIDDTVDDATALNLATAKTPHPFEKTFAKSSTLAKPDVDDFDDLTSDEMIDDLVAEIEGDAAELNALISEDSKKIGPFLKAGKSESALPNGASH